MVIRTRTMALSAIGLLAAGAATGLSAAALFEPQNTPAPVSMQASGQTSEAPIPQIAAPNYRAIVARNQAAVVGITVAGEMKVATPEEFGFGAPNGEDNPLSQFFRRMPAPRGHQMTHAQGSGFIISQDGVILTNAHVVEGATEVMVKLSDHREFKAKVLGSDKTSDIAVIKIEARDLPVVHLGNSDKLSVGDYVLAIGQPFGLEETATAGIVSAKGRSLPGDGYVPFIQTDGGGEPGQLRWAAVRLRRRRRRHQRANLYKFRRLSGRVIRDSDQRRGAGQGSDRQNRQSGACTAGRRNSTAESIAGEFLQFKIAERRVGRQGGTGQRRRPCGNQSRRCDSKIQWRHGDRCRPAIGAGRYGEAGRSGRVGDLARRQSAELVGNHRRRRGCRVGVGRRCQRHRPGQVGTRAAPFDSGRTFPVRLVSGTPGRGCAGPCRRCGHSTRRCSAIRGRHTGGQRRAAAEMVKQHDKQIALLIQRGDSRVFVPVDLG